MKIVVATPYDSSNFGAYLQAYCLKRHLETKGHEVVHIPTRSASYVRNLYYHDRPVAKREKLFRLQFKRKQAFGKRKWKIFSEAHKQFHVEQSAPADTDLFILGSDEVWNVRQPAFRKDVFWGIGMSPVISYAASIGKAALEDMEKYPEQINAIRRMSAVLVRDARTKEFVEKHSDHTAEIVCDPSMLVPVKDYGISCDDEYVKNHDCLLIYSYLLTTDERKAIRQYAAANGLKTVSCCFYHDWCDHTCECGPLEFSDLMRQCRAVVTTTFHGSIFSILNHMDFISITSNPKTVQLLQQLHLEDHLIDSNNVSGGAIGEIFGRHPDYERVDAEITEAGKRSSALLEKAMAEAVGQKETFDYQICRSDNCTGCFACMNKCPKSAINVVTDSIGRTLPMIDHNLCVKCGLCKKVCPVNHPAEKREPLACYAAQVPSEEKRRKSSSGAIGAVLTETVIQSGGVAYGAAVTEGVVVRHMRAETVEEGNRFRGSKYVQSFIGNSYQQVLKDLKEGRKVLFTGTPCQIAGLYNYLGYDDENLYTADIICHGIPPMQFLKEYIQTVSGGAEVTSLSFRGGQKDFMLSLFSGGRVIYSGSRDEDPYYRAFMKTLSYRENCYSCPYAAKERVSDITIGDFWGLHRETLKTEQEGRVSVVLINTGKGGRLWELLQSKLTAEPRDLDEAVRGNPQLRRPSFKHRGRQSFVSSYLKNGDFLHALSEAGIDREISRYKLTCTVPYRALRKIKRIIYKENGKE